MFDLIDFPAPELEPDPALNNPTPSADDDTDDTPSVLDQLLEQGADEKFVAMHIKRLMESDVTTAKKEGVRLWLEYKKVQEKKDAANITTARFNVSEKVINKTPHELSVMYQRLVSGQEV